MFGRKDISFFAHGGHGLVKLEMDRLWEDQYALDVIFRELAMARGLPEPDVVLGVPSGGQRLVYGMSERGYMVVPVVRLARIPGDGKRDFMFESEEDFCLAQRATSVRIYEDVVSTMSSVAGVLRLLDPSRQDIHSLAIWRRGPLVEEFTQGVTPHFLVEEEVPIYEPETCPICV